MEWKKVRLGEIADYVTSSIKSDHIDLNEYVTTDSMLQNKCGRVKAVNLPPNTCTLTRFQKGDVLMANIRPYLKKLWLADCEGGCSTDVLVFRAKEQHSSLFLYHVLLQDTFFDYVMKGVKGSKMPRGDKRQIMSFPLPALDFYTECRIAAVLSAIDRKIALNRAIDKNLEAIAKQLYDYWFVQFDFPDSNGRPYKSSGGEMVWNEKLKREIPKGWEILRLAEWMEIKSGFSFSSKKYTAIGRYKVITIKNVQENHLDTSTCDYINELPDGIRDHCILSVGDSLISLTGNCGRICFVTEDNLLLNQRVGLLSCSTKYRMYAHLLLTSKEFQEVCINLASGAAQANLSPIDLCKTYASKPPTNIIDKFNNITNPIKRSFIKNEQEISSLTALRDKLLPLLMNGQVLVKSE